MDAKEVVLGFKPKILLLVSKTMVKYNQYPKMLLYANLEDDDTHYMLSVALSTSTIAVDNNGILNKDYTGTGDQYGYRASLWITNNGFKYKSSSVGTYKNLDMRYYAIP